MQSKFFDNSTHSNLIKKTVYSAHSDTLYSLEQSSSTLKFYSADCQEKVINKKKVGLTVPTDYNKVSFIIDFALAEELNTVREGGVLSSSPPPVDRSRHVEEAGDLLGDFSVGEADKESEDGRAADRDLVSPTAQDMGHSRR